MHRLDAGTTGLMVVAKSERAYRILKDAFRERTVDKTYRALVQGHPDPRRGTIDAPIDRHPKHDWRFAVVAGGRPSITHYETLEAFRAASLLEVHLETGRTHQIRVHFRRPAPVRRRPDLRRRPDPRHPARPDPAVAARRPARVRPPGRRPGRGLRQSRSRRSGRRPGGHRRRVVTEPTSGLTSGPTFTVRLAGPADGTGLHALRRQVFVVEQGVPAELETDAADDIAVHVVAVDPAGEVVGTGRYVERDGHAAVGRMAVAARARGRRIGAAMLRRLEAVAADRGLAGVRLHAQATAEGFYDRAGYAVTGPHFVEAGIDHVPMAKSLPVIRDATDHDSQALAGLIAIAWAAYPGCVLDVAGEEPWLLAPRSAYDSAGGRLWVATLDGAVVGCVGIKPVAAADSHPATDSHPAAELKSLYVAATARRHGLGARLVRLVEDAAVGAGTSALRLWSDTRFREAHAFYAGQGYRPTGASRELHDRSGTVEHEFARDLPRPARPPQPVDQAGAAAGSTGTKPAPGR